MHRGVRKFSSLIFFVSCVIDFYPARALSEPQDPRGSDATLASRVIYQTNVDVYVTGPGGAPVEGSPVVSLIDLHGKVIDQKNAKNGYVRFNDVPISEYNVQVIAPKYQAVSKKFEARESTLAKVTVELAPISDAEEAAASVSFYALSPKAQQEVGKALEELRAHKSMEARKHLEAAQKAAPKAAQIEYLFGVYSSQVNDPVQAKTYWMKTLELDPKHLNALLALGQDLLDEKKSAEAAQYLKRAVETAPSSWRAHALLAQALVLQEQDDEAIKHAERAIELGHERAASAQLVLARATIEKGDKAEGEHILEVYVHEHPGDKDTAKYLERLEHPQPGDTTSGASEPGALAAAASEVSLPSNWLPPNVDEKMPPVETGASCAVDDVVDKAGTKLLELVKDVDRFAATESLIHESINKYGLASSPEKRKFNYVVSIQEVRHGYLNVEEYRNAGSSPADFPDGVATNGLPALVLIFHPYNTPNFEMTCEGLARWNGGLAWQVHFKQRADRPNTIKRYRIGADGPSYPVALKGRAWISADNFQILRLETDLISPVPQIKLIADHSEIEYGPVKFSKGNVNMWLPQSADVYYDWRGKRIHRRHSFSNYLLFAVDDKQKITVPKVDNAPAATGTGDAANSNTNPTANPNPSQN
jgi:Tfp pilus assembly protein PilF